MSRCGLTSQLYDTENAQSPRGKDEVKLLLTSVNWPLPSLTLSWARLKFTCSLLRWYLNRQHMCRCHQSAQKRQFNSAQLAQKPPFSPFKCLFISPPPLSLPLLLCHNKYIVAMAAVLRVPRSSEKSPSSYNNCYIITYCPRKSVKEQINCFSTWFQPR